jgi:hypothetical protein
MTRAARSALRDASIRRWLDRQDVAVSTLEVAAFLGMATSPTRLLLVKLGAVVAARSKRAVWWVAPARWP